jgi:tetratricopeptide (TPR) repeat protein
LLLFPLSVASANALKDFEFAKVLIDEEEWAAAMNFFGLALGEGVLNKQQTAEAYHLRGVSRGRLNKHRLALRDHQRAVRLLPDYVSAWSSICYQHVANTKQLETAMEACNLALTLDPKHAPSYALRAEVWHGKGDNQRAEVDFAQALQLDPKNWGVYFNRGIFYHNLKRPDDARTNLARAYRLAPVWEQMKMVKMDIIQQYGAAK